MTVQPISPETLDFQQAMRRLRLGAKVQPLDGNIDHVHSFFMLSGGRSKQRLQLWYDDLLLNEDAALPWRMIAGRWQEVTR